MDAHGDGEFPRPIKLGTPVAIRPTSRFVSGRVRPTGFHIPSQLMEQLR